MPLYEYICDEDGAVVELLRPMARADEPVPDPDGKGRVFRRAQSAFAAKSGTGRRTPLPMAAGLCPCGRPGGGCGSR